MRPRERFLQGQREVTAAGGQIENRTRFPPGNHPHGPRPPEEIQATGEKVVGEVVARGDGTEDATYLGGILHR